MDADFAALSVAERLRNLLTSTSVSGGLAEGVGKGATGFAWRVDVCVDLCEDVGSHAVAAR